MSFSPLDLLDEDYSGLFSQDYRQSNDKVSRKEPKNKLHETENAHDTHFLDTKDDKTGFKNYPEIVETVVVDRNKQSNYPTSDRQENSINEDWKCVSNEKNNVNMNKHKYEFNLYESTNQMTDDKHSYTEYSKIDIDDEKPIKTKENHVNNLQFNLVHDINEVNINTRKNNSIISSDINDNMEYIEVKESEKDTNKPSNEIEPVIKPAVRTRRHISNSSNQPRICDITLTNENDQSPINTLVISSKEQQNIINDNNDQCITDIIIKSTSQSGDNVHLSPKSSIKRSKSTCSMSNQRVTNRSTYQAYRKSDDFILNAAAIRELAYQSWCNRLVKSARIERMSNLRNEIDETKKEKEKLERLKSNEICFQTWKRNKHQQLIDTIKKRKEEELAQKKKLEEEQERKLNSQKAFDVWKSRKDELTIKQLRDCLSKQKLEKQSKVTEQNEKQHLSQQAYENWKSKKDALLKQQIQSKIKLQTEREKQLEEENRIKMDQAAKAYYQWELKKVVSLENLAISIDHSNKINNRRPWRPPSKTTACTHSYRLY